MAARTADGRAFRILTLIDEYTKECLTILTQRRITSGDVIEQLFHLFVFRSLPQHIRSDNGPEFTAKAIRRWLNDLEVNTLLLRRFRRRIKDPNLYYPPATRLTPAKSQHLLIWSEDCYLTRD